MSAENHIDLHQPKDFVDITTVAPDVQVDMRYFSSHNFIGRPIKGYNAPVCLLTRPAANAVKQVADRLRPFGLTLKIYDCYRPQSAVNDFIAWAKDPSQNQMKNEFYPQVEKNRLFEEGYLAARSGHSRGSTLDLTIVPLDSKIPIYDPGRPLVNCTRPRRNARQIIVWILVPALTVLVRYPIPIMSCLPLSNAQIGCYYKH